MADQILRAVAAGGGIRMVAVETTVSTRYACRRHGLSYLTTTLLGRAMAGGLLLASSMKTPRARVGLRIRCQGPLQGLTVDAGRDGAVRGYVEAPDLELALTPGDRFDLARAVGRGHLQVTRDEGRGDPLQSTVELVSGGIGDDLAAYLFHSEQTPSAVFVGERITRKGIRCSGGVLVQVLPRAASEPALVDLLERECAAVEGFSGQLEAHRGNMAALLQSLFGALDPQPLAAPQPVGFHCRCTISRCRAALQLLGTQELEEMIVQDGGAEMTCHFCGEVYRFSGADLREVIRSLSARAVKPPVKPQ
ncbi:MAG: Hsp33 family molecular chaperone HslO [Cyanobacteria bacterium MAG CAR1_bin_15]|nr:Hsp33 family molecular chaperone HslO [Cyanobacteria bacterium MAG CAR1_bin_15]